MGEALALLLGGAEQRIALVAGAVSPGAQVAIPHRRYAAFLRCSTPALFAHVAAARASDVDWPQVLRAPVWPVAGYGAAVDFWPVDAMKLLVWAPLLNGLIARPLFLTR